MSVGGTDGPPPNAGAGKGLLIAGLVALVVLIAFFLCTTAYVQCSPMMQVPECRPTMRLIFLGLYATTVLLLIRNIFRVVEFSNGWCVDLPLVCPSPAKIPCCSLQAEWRACAGCLLHAYVMHADMQLPMHSNTQGA